MDGLKDNDRVEAEPMPFFTAILVCQLNRCVRPLGQLLLLLYSSCRPWPTHNRRLVSQSPPRWGR